MFITNEQIAEALHTIADALEEQEDNPYRIRSYRRAANSLKKMTQDIDTLVRQHHDLTVIPHIGKKLAEVIKNIVVTGNLNWLPSMESAKPYPESLLKKKKIKLTSLRIYSLITVIDRIINRLKNISDIKKIAYTGEFRRKKETINHLDLIVVTLNIKNVFDQFHSFPYIKYIVRTERNFTIVQLKKGIQLTLHAVKPNQFAAELLYTTGSVDHYKMLKLHAKKRNMNLTKKGLYKNKKNISVESEAQIYNLLGLEFIPPEMRENRQEIAEAAQHNLPKLIELSDIKGDLHCHTNETDGSFTLEEMVEAAQQQGYKYIAITDHSQSLKITNGMDEKRLLNQIEKINKLNEKLLDFTILKSMEVDILENGALDLSNDVLKELDLTVCSIHSKFHLSFEKQTKRIIQAMDNPYFNILGHATGRLLTHRPPYQIDMDAILNAAKERNCFIEVNAQPARLDINDLYCKRAKEIGVKVAISSDAHTTKGFGFMILGVNQARRGWLEAKDVINSLELPKLKKILKR